MLALEIGAIVLGVLNTLALVWVVLCALETKVKEQITDYSLGIAFYNDVITGMQGRDVTPEEEFNIAMMQENLRQQAIDIGLESVPFERPGSPTETGLDSDPSQ